MIGHEMVWEHVEIDPKTGALIRRLSIWKPIEKKADNK